MAREYLHGHSLPPESALLLAVNLANSSVRKIVSHHEMTCYTPADY